MAYAKPRGKTAELIKGLAEDGKVVSPRPGTSRDVGNASGGAMIERNKRSLSVFNGFGPYEGNPPVNHPDRL